MSTDKSKPETSAPSNTGSDDNDSGDDARDSRTTPPPKQDKKSATEESSEQPIRYATRGNILTEQLKAVDKAKDDIRSLSISQKRKQYLCKNRYVELKDVPTWPEHFSEELAQDSAATKWWKRNQDKVVSDVDPDLNAKISVFRGDITTLEIDAIVNAANESLLGGGGVDGVIHRAAGRNLVMECELLNGCSAGNAKITCGYKLPAKNVIHTVGPRGEHPERLQGCYKNSLDLMKEGNLTSVAFPCISTGIFGYPNLNAARVAMTTVRDWLETEEYAQKVERIIFCLFLDKDVEIYNEQLQLFFPVERTESE